MSTRLAARLAYGSLGLTVGLLAAGTAVFALNRGPGASGDVTSLSIAFQTLAPGIAFAAVGAVVATRRSGNAIGWLFLAVGLLFGLYWLAGQYAYYAVFTSPGSLPGGRAIAVSLNSGFVPPLVVLTFIVLLFPTGGLLSRRWRPVAWLASASYATVLVGATILPLDTPFRSIPNPVGVEPKWIVTMIILIGVAGVLLSVVAAFAAVFIRFLRAKSDERAQLKWFVSAAALVPAFLVAHSIADGIAPQALGPIEALFTFVVTAFPVATGIAIFKYRLYDIDLIIRRTLVYGVLSAILAGLYSGSCSPSGRSSAR